MNNHKSIIVLNRSDPVAAVVAVEGFNGNDCIKSLIFENSQGKTIQQTKYGKHTKQDFIKKGIRQTLGAGERLVGIYGVCNKELWITSLGFIVGKPN